MLRRALAIRIKAHGADHPDVGASLGNLGMILSKKGDAVAAEELVRRALAIMEKAHGPDARPVEMATRF